MARTGLGKGLGALIGTPAVATRTDAAESGERVHQINLATIVPSALQPRKDFAREALQELIGSIRQHGIIQPLIVRQVGARDRKSTRLNSSHVEISYAVFCL